MLKKGESLKRIVSCIIVVSLFLSLFAFALNIQPVRASGTIYIRVDGSIDPPTAPIASSDNITYTFTGNTNDSVVVERDNIVVDGAGHTVQGTLAEWIAGIDISGRSNLTIKNTQIKKFYVGVRFYSSSNNNISGNNITNNGFGVEFWESSNNNLVYHNNFVNNAYSIHYHAVYATVWDDGYPSGGNYWSKYSGKDLHSGPYQNETGSDGIGDAPYTIDAYSGGGNIDHYPLMNPYIGPYNVTIKAYCPAEGVDVCVGITMDGSPTGYTTPHTFTNLTGIHTFTVPNSDPNDHPFKRWSTGETSRTVIATSGGTYVACYLTSVGGVVVPVDKFGLLAPYIGLASMVAVAAAASVIYVKHVKHRKENQ